MSEKDCGAEYVTMLSLVVIANEMVMLHAKSDAVMTSGSGVEPFDAVQYAAAGETVPHEEVMERPTAIHGESDGRIESDEVFVPTARLVGTMPVRLNDA